jgi:hypothetical protein
MSLNTNQHIKKELDLLNIIECEQVISQASLSKRLGIAVGLVNFLMKRAISKGIVVAKRVQPKRYAYILTPKGLTEKARLVADYINTSLGVYRNLREDFDNIYKKLIFEGRNEIIIVGDLDLVELAILSAFDIDINIKAVICDNTNRKKIANIDVISNIDLMQKNLKDVTCLIVDLSRAQQVYEICAKKYGLHNVITPQSLFAAHSFSPEGNSQREGMD